MAEITISIGGRDFKVSCQQGEEHFLQAAAKLLDTEASVLTSQIGRIPEARMLLMAGLMLADKTAGLEEQMRGLERKITAQEAVIAEMGNTPPPEPVRIEVAVIPPEIGETMAELAARAEALAGQVEDKAG
jgi:cell division protein ZapA